MQYMLLIYGNEKDWEGAGEEDLTPWFEYSQAAEAAGCLRGGAGLLPTSTATTVRVRGGETMTTDGPFAETKEQIAGYYVISAADLDEAIRLAQAMPADNVVFEIRPIAFRPDA